MGKRTKVTHKFVKILKGTLHVACGVAGIYGLSASTTWDLVDCKNCLGTK